MAKREFNGVEIKVEFNETANRQQISSGDKINVLFGKIRKWLSDLKPVAFSGSYDDLQNAPTIPDKVSQLENDAGYAKTASPTFTGSPKAPTPAGTDNSTRIATIPQVEYKQLLDLKTRVDVAVERMTNDKYCNLEDVLCILGTELALQRADEIREEERLRHEEYLKQCEEREGN